MIAVLVKVVAAVATITVEGWHPYCAATQLKEDSDAASDVETAATKETKAAGALDAPDEAKMAAGAAAQQFPHYPPCPPPASPTT